MGSLLGHRALRYGDQESPTGLRNDTEESHTHATAGERDEDAGRGCTYGLSLTAVRMRITLAPIAA